MRKLRPSPTFTRGPIARPPTQLPNVAYPSHWLPNQAQNRLATPRRGQPILARYNYKPSTRGQFAGFYYVATSEAVFAFPNGFFYSYPSFALSDFQLLTQSSNAADDFGKTFRRPRPVIATYSRILAVPAGWDLSFP